MKKKSGDLSYLLAIVLFSILGMKALIAPGLFTAHDISHQVVRFFYYSQTVNGGQFPPYWIGRLANGFGYPLFFFSYHLPWIIGVALLKAGLDIPNALKTLLFLSYIGSGFTMYFFVKSLFKNRFSALLSSILYLWLPYHFLIIFVGASLGIAFVYIFLPLLFLGIHLTRDGSKIGIPILALGLSGLILSHIMHLIFLFPIIFIFLLWEFLNIKRRAVFFKNICFGLILGILISSFYLIPAAYYNKSTRAHEEGGFYEVYKRNFINFNQLLYSKWGYGPIINNAKNGENSFQLGFAQWISILILIMLIIFRKLAKNYQSLSIFLLSGFAISVFLMLDHSKSLWAFLVKFASVDFPFRLILPASFIASICAALVYLSVGKKMKFLFFLFLTFTALYSNRNHINVNQYTNFPIKTYLDLETEITTNTFNEYLPIEANSRLLNRPWNEIIADNTKATNVKQTANSLSFDLNTQNEEIISVGQYYFPGQTLYLDNKQTKFGIDKEGRLSFLAPKGIYNVTVRYQETTLIKISKALTLIGILIITVVFLKEIKLFKKKSNF